MWAGGDEAADVDCARGCFRHLEAVFAELADFRAFELLRNHKTRANYLLLKQARIVAMTCTHAAIARRQLLALGFRYDNLVMEEAAQVLEVETIIPMLLQPSHDGALRTAADSASGQRSAAGCRLQRVCLIGDHHQLPPVVKNMALQKYSNLDQTLFTRFIRLGVPHVLLDQQGRARPEMAALYSWRYGGKLGNLAAVEPQAAAAAAPSGASPYAFANAGFQHTFQFVDVPEFMGRGESTPSAFFYQNLGEAEYCVACFQYMRLLGYPAHKISILTTYNGQKSLIRDVLNDRCASHPAFGLPARVTTVDKYQGQQNDYVLLSLVRTSAVGHLRDVRRLVVALSRARLGLYVFGRLDTFKGCFELAPAFKLLLAKPTTLQLVLGERWPASRSSTAAGAAPAATTHALGGSAAAAAHAATELGGMVQAMLGMAHQAQQAAYQLQAGATTADPQDATTAATAATAAVADAEGRGGAVGGSDAAEGGAMQDSDDETEVDNEE
jgi:intron-binding protein aquarius